MRRLRRLVQKRSLRWSEGVCVLEGPDLIRAALATGQEFEGVYVDLARATDDDLVNLAADARSRGVRVVDLDVGVLQRIADAQSPQGVLAAIRFVPRALPDVSARGITVVLHDVRDPGNAGTIIRTADAAGATAVIISGHSVDPYNPKTLRATAGSIFHLPVVVASTLEEVTHWAKHAGAVTMATVVRDGTSYRDLDLGGDVVVVFGNEGDGLSEDDIANCDERLSIPMAGRNESLNVSVAAGVVLFAALSQRSVPATEPSRPNIEGP